jgi:predicted RNase H-like nuclease (RuvC/YqgF family)
MGPAYKKALFFVGLLVCFASAGHGQSLGDVAREHRQKQQAKDGKTAAKVITNEDLPEHTDLEATSSTDEANHDEEPNSRLASKSSEQWKAEISAQRNSVEALQSQIDKLNSSIHFVEANRYWNGVQYNQHQEQKQEEVQRMRSQLEEQKKKLEEMQEAARKEGYGNAVYEQ